MSESVMETLRALNPYVPVASDVLCMASTVVASKFVLRRWIALSSHIPAPLSDEEKTASEDQSAEPTPTTPARWRGRLFNRKAAKALAVGCAIWIVEMFVFVALPWIASGDVLTMVWAVFWFVANIAILFNGISTWLPYSQRMSYSTKNPSGPLPVQIQIDVPYKYASYVRAAMAAAVTAVLFWTGYNGVSFLGPLFAASFLSFMITAPIPAKISVRGLIKLFYIIMVGAPLAMAILIGIITAILSSGIFGEIADDSVPKQSQVNPWLFKLLFNALSPMKMMVGALLVALTLRFDYTRDPATRPIIARSTEPVEVPRKLPKFKASLSATGMCALFVSISLSRLGVSMVRMPEDVRETFLTLVTMYVSLLLVSTAVALKARQEGVLRDWWTYEETWMPKLAAVTDAAEVDDVERALLKPTGELDDYPLDKTSV